MKKAVINVRVSSDRQEEEGFSIPAQRKLLQDYASKNGFDIVAEFVAAESSKKAGRAEFLKLVDFIRKNPDVRDVLVEKHDRLYRNLKDYVDLDPEALGIRIHFVKEGDVLSKESKSSEKFIHGIKVLMAKQYIVSFRQQCVNSAERSLYARGLEAVHGAKAERRFGAADSVEGAHRAVA